MQIYIVFFNTGVYDSSTHDFDKAFLSKEKAEQYCEEKNDLLKFHKVYWNETDFNSIDFRWSRECIDVFEHLIDYTGAKYTIEELEVIE